MIYVWVLTNVIDIFDNHEADEHEKPKQIKSNVIWINHKEGEGFLLCWYPIHLKGTMWGWKRPVWLFGCSGLSVCKIPLLWKSLPFNFPFTGFIPCSLTCWATLARVTFLPIFCKGKTLLTETCLLIPMHSILILKLEIKLYEKSNRIKGVVCKGVTFELSSDQYCCWGIFLA